MSEHYFSERPAGERRSRTVSVELAGAPRTVTTAGGVFSPEQLDRGTRVLLDSLPPARSGPVLDLGCGWGPIALATALEAPDIGVWAVDVNERARELTAENARALGLPGITVAAPDAVPPGIGFAEIRSNPPIRVGKAALHAMLRQWLPRLLPGGTASLVVAKHLGAESLQRWLAAEFPGLDVSRVARSHGFHVIAATADDAA